MALRAKHKKTEFGVGDVIRVIQMVEEGEKTRHQAFEGIVMGIKGRDETRSFTVRRIGAGQIGIERIFPIHSPNIDSIEVVRKGMKGVKRAKLYYTRKKSKKQIEKIYSRANIKENSKENKNIKKETKKSEKTKKSKKKTKNKKTAKNASKKKK